MKNVIAVTACLKRCSIAVSYCGKIFYKNEKTDAATNLASLLQNVLRENAIDIKKIEGVMTASGPGSFTGIRVAQSLTKALVLTLKIPGASVNYFEIIDHIANTKARNRLLIVKSEKNQAYFKEFQKQKEEIGVSSYENILKRIAEHNIPLLVGEQIPEVCENIDKTAITYREINDFRDARHLLAFSQIKITNEVTISPMYINASA